MQSLSFSKPNRHYHYTSPWQRLHIDFPLVASLILLMSFGLVILYSASSSSMSVMVRQLVRFAIAFITLVILAQIPPEGYKRWSPWFYGLGMLLLLAVMVIGTIGKGAQRWLDLGFVRFQPSELMKIAVPMMVAWFFHNRILPPKPHEIVIASLIILLPTAIVMKQPDLGTAIMLMMAGGCVLLFAGLSWRFFAACGVSAAVFAPIFWHFLHDYQKQRVLTFLNPERDPLGSGYHIIQSKIAIGSGGLLGKGWLNGSQSHLHFLPEHATDFIFAVCGEEFGLLGGLIIIALYLLILARSLYIASHAQDTYSRLLAGGIGLSFFLAAFVNIGMVTGILPVVGLPLPLVSYGGTSMVTLMAGFGMLMSIHTHRKLLG